MNQNNHSSQTVSMIEQLPLAGCHRKPQYTAQIISWGGGSVLWLNLGGGAYVPKTAGSAGEDIIIAPRLILFVLAWCFPAPLCKWNCHKYASTIWLAVARISVQKCWVWQVCGAFPDVAIHWKFNRFAQSEVPFLVFKQRFSALFKKLEQTDSSCRTTGLTDSAPALRTFPPVSCSQNFFWILFACFAVLTLL